MYGHGAVPPFTHTVPAVCADEFLSKLLYSQIHFAACRAYGVLLWEMVTYGAYPYAQMEVSEIAKAARKGTLRLQW